MSFMCRTQTLFHALVERAAIKVASQAMVIAMATEPMAVRQLLIPTNTVVAVVIIVRPFLMSML